MPKLKAIRLPMQMPEVKRRGKEMFLISAPMIVEQSFITLMGIVSSLLVRSVGEHAVSAVSMIDSISNLIIAFYAALTTGGTIVVAQYIGRRDTRKAKSAAGQAIILSLSFSILIMMFFTIFRSLTINLLFSDAEPDVITAANRFMLIVNFSYPFLAVTQTSFGILRGSGNTGTPMLISMFMNIVNLFFGITLIRGINFAFINIPGYGITGAAFALLIARIAGFIVCLIYLTRGSKDLRLNSLNSFKPNLSMQKTILGLGIPTSVESTIFQMGKLLTLTYIVKMSTEAIAANSMAGSITGLINVPGSAFSTAVMVLAGQKIGRGETDDIRRTTVFAVLMSMVMLGVLCFIFFLFSEPIIMAYKPEPATYKYLREILNVAFIAQFLLWPFAFITPAVLRATGDVKFTMVVSIASMWTFRILLGYLFGIVLEMGVVGVWLAMFSDWIARGIVFNMRLYGGKWKNKGIKDN